MRTPRNDSNTINRRNESNTIIHQDRTIVCRNKIGLSQQNYIKLSLKKKLANKYLLYVKASHVGLIWEAYIDYAYFATNGHRLNFPASRKYHLLKEKCMNRSRCQCGILAYPTPRKVRNTGLTLSNRDGHTSPNLHDPGTSV